MLQLDVARTRAFPTHCFTYERKPRTNVFTNGATFTAEHHETIKYATTHYPTGGAATIQPTFMQLQPRNYEQTEDLHKRNRLQLKCYATTARA